MTAQKRIGVREVEALRAGEEIWDTAVRGFGARRRGGPSVSYFVMFRTAEGRLRRYTIGQHGAPWTPDQARTKALSVLAEAKVHGTDPAARKKAAREAANVNDLCDLYWADAEAGRLMTRQRQAKKPSTLLSDKGRIDKHIRPLLGQMKVAAVTSADVEAFMHDVAAGKTAVRAKTGKKRGLSNVRGGRGAASRTVGLLGAIFTSTSTEVAGGLAITVRTGSSLPTAIMIILELAYFSWFWSTRGASLGQQLVGIRVVDSETGAALKGSQAAVRYLGYILSGIPLLLGFIWAGFDSKKQGWMDKLAGTQVVRSR